MNLLLVFGILFTSLSNAATLTYWLDQSCKDPKVKDKFDAGLAEAKQMGQRAAYRLGISDQDNENSFKRVYSTDRSDQTLYKNPKTNDATAFDTVSILMSSIGNDWSEVPDSGREQSDVRFYCDGNNRWTPHPTRTGYWEDRVNQMETNSGDDHICIPGDFGVTYKAAQYSTTQKMRRATISLCDETFSVDGTDTNPTQLSDLGKDKALDQFKNGIDDLAGLVSMTILHELTHTYEYLLTDETASSGAYGWKDIETKPTQESLTNSDNYSYFGLLAILEDFSSEKVGYGGWALRRPVSASSQNFQQSIQDAKDGKLRYYKSIVKRDLEGMAPRKFVA